MPTSPISLIQWLKEHEHRETKAALTSFAAEVNIYHADVLTKAQARDALRTWFKESKGNCQYCFIGAHGIPDETGVAIGIGASENAAEFVEWKELWNWFADAGLSGGLWLGACKSSDAALAFSECLANSVQIPFRHIYGFSDIVYTPEIEEILKKLIAFTGVDNPPDLGVEPELLRVAVPGTKVELFYAAATLNGTMEYVNVDDMKQKVGVEFRELLERERLRHRR